MAKFRGKIGYAVPKETSPGVWKDVIEERTYTGDVLRTYSTTENSGSLNDNINVSAEISIVSDPFADQHFYMMKYVDYWGTKWKVKRVDPKYPRLILTLGGVYNGR